MLQLTIVAALGAAVVRTVRGDRGAHLPPIHGLPLALGACLLQIVLFASPLAGRLAPWALGIHVISLVLIGLVVAANRRSKGVSLLALGLLLNVLVMSFNTGFMPVSASAVMLTRGPDAVALMASGVRQQKTFLMQSDTPLWVLGDVLPVPLVGKVYSLGDLVAGLGALVFLSARPRSSSRADRP